MDVGRWTFAFLVPLTFGCARLPAGPVPRLASLHPPTVLLVRGFQDWYSTGIDQLADQLRSDGLPANVFRDEQWPVIADALAVHPNPRLILIGFSYGADDVILISRKLNDRHIPIDLLITLDPVTPANIPANVKRCFNFYEPNGFWDIFPWLRGVPVTADKNATVENINVRANPDLNQPGMSHATIAGDEKIHDRIVMLCKSIH